MKAKHGYTGHTHHLWRKLNTVQVAFSLLATFQLNSEKRTSMKRTPSLWGKQSQAKTTPIPEYAIYRDPILKGEKKGLMLFIPRLLLLEKKIIIISYSE